MTSDDKRVMSGFPSLDKITGGFRPGSVNVIAGRPGAGKTTFALNVAYNAAVKYNKRVLFYSLVESKTDIANMVLLFAPKDPMDIANMVMYLCSEKAGFITGENICIDGGMTRQMIYHGDHGWKLEQ